MAKQKPTSRAAARTAAQKKSPLRKNVARKAAGASTTRKAIKADDGKARDRKARDHKAKDRKAKGRKLAGALAAAKPLSRPKQRIAINHYRDEDFKADGLRAYAHYRDLGIANATHGLAQAHVIRLIGPCNPAEVSKLHFHEVELQLIYVLKGWVKTYMEGQGETLMQEGSCWSQPPRLKHLILDYSDHCELLEVILPAEFRTVELAA